MAYRMKPTERVRHSVCYVGVVVSAPPLVEPVLHVAAALCPGKPNGGADGPHSQVSLRPEEPHGDPKTFPVMSKPARKIQLGYSERAGLGPSRYKTAYPAEGIRESSRAAGGRLFSVTEFHSVQADEPAREDVRSGV